MIPTVGRIVWYVDHAPESALPARPHRPLAAVITKVEPNDCTGLPEQRCDVKLAVLDDEGGLYFTTSVPFSPKPYPGCWTWPPRL